MKCAAGSFNVIVSLLLKMMQYGSNQIKSSYKFNLLCNNSVYLKSKKVNAHPWYD